MKALCIQIIVLAALVLTGCSTGRRMASETTAVQEAISQLRAQWYNAYYSGDTQTLDRIEADDFVVIGSSGEAETTEGRYASIQDKVRGNQWFAAGTTMGADDVVVRSYGEVAVVHGRFSPEVGSQGKGAAVTEVWVRRDGAWQVVHLHFHPMQ